MLGLWKNLLYCKVQALYRKTCEENLVILQGPGITMKGFLWETLVYYKVQENWRLGLRGDLWLTLLYYKVQVKYFELLWQTLVYSKAQVVFENNP